MDCVMLIHVILIVLDNVLNVVVKIVLGYVLVEQHLKLKNVLAVRQQLAQIWIMELVVRRSEEDSLLVVNRNRVDAVSKITASLVILQILVHLAEIYVILNHGRNLSNEPMQKMFYVGVVLDQMSVVPLDHVITQMVVVIAILDVLNIGIGEVSKK